jgi:hypothetical protein
MPTIEFWPEQPHHLLQAGGETLEAGDTFEASEEDLESLLSNPELRIPAAGEREETHRRGRSTPAQPQGTASGDQPSGDGRSDTSATGDA